MRPLILWSALAALLGHAARHVEDGQFTREYSRLYTGLVLALAALLALAIAAGLWQMGQRKELP